MGFIKLAREMTMTQLSEEILKEKLLRLCEQIANSKNSRLNALCLYGSETHRRVNDAKSINALIVLKPYKPVVKTYRKTLDNINFFILAVDQYAFEKDVERGGLGEFVASKVIFLYKPLFNEDYLGRQEIKAKKRIIWELLQSIVLEYPELSSELLIKKEYFMYETMMQRAKLFSAATYSFLRMLASDVRERNVSLIMEGYLKALEELAQENRITLINGHITISQNFIDSMKGRRAKIPVFLRSVQRAALFHILSLLPQMTSPFIKDEVDFRKTQGFTINEDLTSRLEDPKTFLFVSTPLGPISLSDETTIEDFVRKNIPGGKVGDMKIEGLGGVLNDVYLLTFNQDGEERRIVVKKFRNWWGFKWFPLALWALGTQSFALLGQSRLEREYAINRLLHKHGVCVPRILYMSLGERLIFREFVVGENFERVIKRIISTKGKAAHDVALVREAAKTIASAHRLGVALGDCKPENIIVTGDGKTCIVDLEQASRDSNQAWDVAEFLYYSGHYVFPTVSTHSVELITKEFVQGYLEAGGKRGIIKRAGSPRYTKVFSVFTPPLVILTISNLCKKIGELESSK